MLKNDKYFCLIFLLTFFLLNSRISFAVELTGKEPKVDDFNKERKVPPPIDQPNLLKKPQDDQKSTSDIKIKISQFNFTGNTVISNEQLKDLTSEFIGKELSYDDLKDVLRLRVLSKIRIMGSGNLTRARY